MYVGLITPTLASDVYNNYVNNSPLSEYFINKEESVVNSGNISLSEIISPKYNKIIYLKKPILFKMTSDENGIYYDSEEYNIYAYGKTQEEAMQDVYDCFQMIYSVYGLEDDNVLSESAKALKCRILDIYGGEIDAKSN